MYNKEHVRGQNTVMNVKFTNTTSTKLSSLAITNGQLIALSDKPQISYDLGGVRKHITFSDKYTSSAGTAAGGVGASSYALATAYNALNNKIIQTFNRLERVTNDSLFASQIYSATFSFYDAVAPGTVYTLNHGIANVDIMWIDMSNSFFYATSSHVGEPIVSPFYIGSGTGTTNLNESWTIQADREKIQLYSNGSWNTAWYKVVTVRYTKL